MIWRTNYISDSGKIFHYISLHTDSDWLPEIYKVSAVRARGFCDFPDSQNPRYALITGEDGTNRKIEYPFAPGSAEWISFWEEIRNNPLITSSKGIGETVKLRRN